MEQPSHPRMVIFSKKNLSPIAQEEFIQVRKMDVKLIPFWLAGLDYKARNQAICRIPSVSLHGMCTNRKCQ